MKKYFLLVTAIAAGLLSASTSFAYTTCSDSTGANRYEDYNFRGGPAPTKKTVMDDVKIYLDSQLASESIYLNDGTKNEGPYKANLSQDSKVVLNAPNNWVQDYAIQVSVGPTKPLPVVQRFFWMVCHEDNLPVP